MQSKERGRRWTHSRHGLISCNAAEKTFATHLLDYFKEIDGLTELQAKVKGATKQNWYGVVHGTHFYAALLELASEDEIWQALQLPVTLLDGVYSLNALKRMARCQNARHSERYFVRTNLFDALNGPKEGYARYGVK